MSFQTFAGLWAIACSIVAMAVWAAFTFDIAHVTAVLCAATIGIGACLR